MQGKERAAWTEGWGCPSLSSSRQWVCLCPQGQLAPKAHLCDACRAPTASMATTLLREWLAQHEEGFPRDGQRTAHMVQSEAWLIAPSWAAWAPNPSPVNHPSSRSRSRQSCRTAASASCSHPHHQDVSKPAVSWPAWHTASQASKTSREHHARLDSQDVLRHVQDYKKLKKQVGK